MPHTALRIALAAALLLGCGSTDSPPAPEGPFGQTGEAIQGGIDDTTHTFAVGVCFVNMALDGSLSCDGLCSGVLITPNLVVTARHCVQETSNEIDCTKNPQFGDMRPTFAVTTRPNLLLAVAKGGYNVTNVTVPSSTGVCGSDIALLQLERLVPSSEALPATPAIAHDLTDTTLSGAFTAIGYGATTPRGDAPGLRRIRSDIPIRCIPGDPKIPCPPIVNANEFLGGDGVCQGDSGSSAFEQGVFDGSPSTALSLGVLSRGSTSEDQKTCIGSLYTRLDSWRALIVDAAKQASSDWTLYPEPSWTVYVPPTPKPPKPAPTKKVGEACADASECISSLCGQVGDIRQCTSACTDDASCPDGFTCQGGYCWTAPEAPPPLPPAPEGDPGGCSLGNTHTSWEGGGLFGAVAWLLLRRPSRRQTLHSRAISCRTSS